MDDDWLNWAYSVEFWALPPDGGDAVELADATDWEFAPQDGDWGAIKLAYPPIAPHYDLLQVVTERDRDIEIEIVVGDNLGREKIMRGILYTFDQDDSKNDGLATLTGHFTECLFGETVIPFNPDDVATDPEEGEERDPDDEAGEGRTFVSGTGGQIAAEFMLAAQARGALHDVLWRPEDLGDQAWTDSHDSRGNEWINRAAIGFNPGQHYAAMLGTLHGYQLCEWRLTHDRKLILTNLDGMGVDRTLPGPDQVTLEYGRDFDDAPRRHTVKDAITDLLTSGQNGSYAEAGDPSARARRGRRIEGFRSFGNATAGTLDALTQRRLGTFTDGKLELSHHLVLGPGSPLPFLDYDVYDWILSDTRRDTTRRRVVQIRLAGDKDSILSASLTLNTMIDEHAVQERRRLEALESGAVTVGLSRQEPDVDDGRPIRAVERDSIVVTSEWYSTREGVGVAAAFAQWTPVPDARVDGYAVAWRYTGAVGNLTWQWLPKTEQGRASVSWSNLVPGAPIELFVYAVNRWGRYSDGAGPVPHVLRVKQEPPPVAMAPTPYSSRGGIVVPWSGTGVSGEAMPDDFLTAEIHASLVANFDVDRPVTDDGELRLTESTTFVGELRGRGEYPLDAGVLAEVAAASGGIYEYGQTYHVRIVTRDRSGNASAPSAVGSVELLAIQDGEIAELLIGKLKTGVLEAVMTVAGLIRTGLAGARVELDRQGLRCIADDDRVLFEFSIPQSLLTIVGRVIAGAGVGNGRTVVVDPEGPRIIYYPDATLARIEQRAWIAGSADGSGNAQVWESQMYNAEGVPDGPFMQMGRNNVHLGLRRTNGGRDDWIGAWFGTTRTGGGIYSDGVADLISDNGQAKVEGRQAVLGTPDGNYVFVPAGGSVEIVERGGGFVAMRPSGVLTNRTFGDSSDGLRFGIGGGQGAGYHFALASGTNRCYAWRNSDGTPFFELPVATTYQALLNRVDTLEQNLTSLRNAFNGHTHG